MCGLTLIGPARLDTVVGADGNVDFFFPVFVHVSEEQVEGTVRDPLPAFISRINRLAFRIGELSIRGLAKERNGSAGSRTKKTSGQHNCSASTMAYWPPPPVAAIFGRGGVIGPPLQRGHPIRTSLGVSF